MPGALPLLLVAILTPTGIWHVGAPGPNATQRPALASAKRIAGSGPALVRSIVVRGLDSRGAMPATAPTEGSAVAPEGRGQATPVALGRPIGRASGAARARAPPV
jgi:hypothetical protein